MNRSIIFLSDNPSNSTVVDGEDNAVLFQISTPSGFKKSVTTITDKDGRVVGAYERKWSSERVSIRGEEKKLEDWMTRKRDLYGSHVFGAPDERTYNWKYRKGADSLKLVDEAAQKTVGKAHSAHHLFDKRQMRVDFDPGLGPIIDVILLAFVICEEEHRENQQAAAGT